MMGEKNTRKTKETNKEMERGIDVYELEGQGFITGRCFHDQSGMGVTFDRM
jgi:hypothetical protein